MMCRNNEHIFCRGCITEHLTVNSHTCPECKEDLTVETLRYQNSAVLFCACSETDYCVEVSLAAPYAHKQLGEIPEPPRKHYRAVAFEHKVLIFGGKSGDRFLDSVLEFDLITNDITAKPSLPYAVKDMAGVRWGDQAILIEGLDKHGKSKKVLMYNSKTGTTTEMPSMLEERSGCSAVITGNIIVVIGGMGRFGRVRSVEALTLGGYSWRHLPAMNEIRSLPIATVLPTKNIP